MSGSKGRKKKYVKKSFESDQSSSDVSANIYKSMMMSEAFKALSDRQVRLYLYCKLQYYAESRKPQLWNGETSEYFFTMNEGKWKTLYGLYTDNIKRKFYRDMDILIDFGFIDKVESGKNTRTKNIYKFSDRWQSWRAPKKP